MTQEKHNNSLKEAAWDCVLDNVDVNNPVLLPKYKELLTYLFIAGAEWMAVQGVTLKVTDDTTWGEVNDFIHRNCDGAKEIQIRKKEESK